MPESFPELRTGGEAEPLCRYSASKSARTSPFAQERPAFRTSLIPKLAVPLCQCRLRWPCKVFCVRLAEERYLPSFGIRPSNRMAKWLRACFQLRIGIVHFLAAS